MDCHYFNVPSIDLTVFTTTANIIGVFTICFFVLVSVFAVITCIGIR